MQLDITSLIVVTVVFNLVSAAVIYWSWINRATVGERKWAAALLIDSFGMLLVMLQTVLTPILSVVTANVLLAIGFTFRYLSICEFFERRSHWFWTYAPTVFTLVAFLVFYDNLHLRIISSTVVHLAQVVAILLIIMNGEIPGAVHSAKLMRTYFILALVTFSLRLLGELMSPTIGNFVTDGSSDYAMGALILLGLSLLSSFGVLTILREKLDEENRRLATLDPLTGIFNRRSLLQFIERELLRSYRTNRWPSLLMLDVDHFKQINDQHGHLVGDQTLVALANLITGQMRDLDVVGRYGGEEFCILLAETDQGGALVSAERLREAIEKLKISTDEGTLGITVSIGISCAHAGDSIDQIISRADTALYRAKAAGRNSVVCADQ